MASIYFQASRNQPGSLYKLYERLARRQAMDNNEDKKKMNKSSSGCSDQDYDVVLKAFRCLLIESNCASDIYTMREPENLLVYDKKLGPVYGMICYIDLRVFAVCIYNLRTLEVSMPWIESNLFTKEKGKRDGVKLVRQVPTYGFGYDPDAKEYKVVCVWRCEFSVRTPCGRNRPITVWDVVCEILTVGQNSWRRIHEVPPYDLEGASFYANGSIYWKNFKILNDKWDIVAFDVGSEKFRVIPIPDLIIDKSVGPCISLLEIDGRLALLREIKLSNDYTFGLWVSDDGCKEYTSIGNCNWIEETITLPFCRGRYQWLYFHPVAGSSKIIIEAYGGILTDVKFARLYSYDRKKKTFKKFGTGANSLMNLCSSSMLTSLVERLLPVQKRKKYCHRGVN